MATQLMALCIAMALCISIKTPVSDGLPTYQMCSVLQFRLQSLPLGMAEGAKSVRASLQLATRIRVLLAS